jgi:hypothetical protein
LGIWQDSSSPLEDHLTDSTPASPDSPLVDRVLVEMARRRALADALRPPKRRPQTPAGAPRAKLPQRRHKTV